MRVAQDKRAVRGNLMFIRAAIAADKEMLAHIRRQAILVLALPAIGIEQAEQWASQAAADRIARALQEHAVWVAMDDSGAAGWVECAGDRIAALYVLPRCARQGVGSALLRHAEIAIWRSGATAVRLESSQNALDFYLRRGYRHCAAPTIDGAIRLCKAREHD